jgi:PIN domain nuclease of toxin-antitoxin system
MAVLLDAYAAIAILKGEPAAKEIRPTLEAGDAVIHPLNLGEVIDRMSRLAGADPDDIEADVALLGVDTVDADAATLVDAGRWRARRGGSGAPAASDPPDGTPYSGAGLFSVPVQSHPALRGEQGGGVCAVS